MIFWILVISLGIMFFGLWVLTVKQRIDNLNEGKIQQDFNLPILEEQFKDLPKLELPKIDPQELKQIEDLFKVPTP
jgi:hypothetical protein